MYKIAAEDCTKQFNEMDLKGINKLKISADTLNVWLQNP